MTDDKIIIFNIQKFSLQDGPGIRTTIFLKGCPLACKWCSNPESQNPFINIFINDKEKTKLDLKKDEVNFDENGYIIEDDLFYDVLESKRINDENIKYSQVGRVISVDRLVEIAMEDEVFYKSSKGGVTISGGEAFMQNDLLLALVKKLKEKNLHTAIETSLFTKYENINKLFPYIDLFIVDCKHWNDKLHQDKTGLSNEIILRNISKVVKNSKDYLVRIPVIPDFNYSEDDFQEFAQLFKKLGVKKVQLLPFHQYGKGKYENYGIKYEYSDKKALNDSDLEKLVHILTEEGIYAFV